jgi:hypothetical protein
MEMKEAQPSGLSFYEEHKTRALTEHYTPNQKGDKVASVK